MGRTCLGAWLALASPNGCPEVADSGWGCGLWVVCGCAVWGVWLRDVGLRDVASLGMGPWCVGLWCVDLGGLGPRFVGLWGVGLTCMGCELWSYGLWDSGVCVA